MPDDAPSRRDFEQLAASVRELTVELKSFADRMDRIYVRKDVYAGDQKTHDLTHREHDEAIGSLNRARNAVINLVLGAVGASLLGLVLLQRWGG